MSAFKRMKLVSDEKNADSNRRIDELSKLMKYQIPINLQRMSDLDSNINEILSRNIDQETKAKLYTQALRRFLTFKQQHIEDSSVQKLEEKPLKKSVKKRKKKLKTPTKRITKASLTPKKPIITTTTTKIPITTPPTTPKKKTKQTIKKTTTNQAIQTSPATSQQKTIPVIDLVSPPESPTKSTKKLTYEDFETFKARTSKSSSNPRSESEGISSWLTWSSR